MKRFLFPLFLIALGLFGITEHDAINDQLAAMYPDDAVHQTALARCYQENHQFDRFSARARAACYEKYLPPEVAATPVPDVTAPIPVSPAAAAVPPATAPLAGATQPAAAGEPPAATQLPAGAQPPASTQR